MEERLAAGRSRRYHSSGRMRKRSRSGDKDSLGEDSSSSESRKEQKHKKDMKDEVHVNSNFDDKDDNRSPSPARHKKHKHKHKHKKKEHKHNKKSSRKEKRHREEPIIEEENQYPHVPSNEDGYNQQTPVEHNNESTNLLDKTKNKSNFFASLKAIEDAAPPVGTFHATSKRREDGKLEEASSSTSTDWTCHRCTATNFRQSMQCHKCKAMKRMTTWR